MHIERSQANITASPHDMIEYECQSATQPHHYSAIARQFCTALAIRYVLHCVPKFYLSQKKRRCKYHSLHEHYSICCLCPNFVPNPHLLKTLKCFVLDIKFEFKKVFYVFIFFCLTITYSSKFNTIFGEKLNCSVQENA